MRQFHELNVVGKSNETRDSIRIALDVPDELREEFAFLPGQHLPISIVSDGKTLRRTYSICSVPGTAGSSAYPIDVETLLYGIAGRRQVALQSGQLPQPACAA